MSNSNKTKIYSELICGVPGGYVTDVSQVRGAASSLVTQTIPLYAGWNWVSFYVDVTMEDLKAALGTNGVQIKDQNSFTDYGTNTVTGVTGWWGNLKELSKTSMYMIQVSADCTIQLTGKLLDPEEVPITLAAGTDTWISFISDKEMSVADALSNLTPENGDQITTFDGFCEYIAAAKVWWGHFETLKPSKGYRYTSKSASEKTFVYPSEMGKKLRKVLNEAKEYTDNASKEKQDTLVSGINIKTVNSESILGSGNLNILNFDLNVKGINHRGFSSVAPENTIPAYILSKKMGFTYVEGDVSFTSDSVAVLLHDSTIDRTSDGSGNITSLTYQKVLQYDFGSWKSEEYAGVKIPTFKEWMICCKNLGLHPYIELKSAGGYTQAQINQVVSEVEECGMKGKVTYISFNNTYLGYVKNADGYARLGLLANPLNSTKISQAKALRTGTNEVFLDAKLSTVTSALISTLISDDLPLEVWTINTESEIISMSPYISGVTSDNLVAGKILYDNSLTYTPPVSLYVATESVALDYDTLEFSDKSSKSLTASIQPSNATEPIMWQSSNDSVATVSHDGVVTPISDGECTVTATSDGISDSCEVNVAFTRFNVVKNIQGGLFENNDSTVVIGDSYTDTIIPQDGFSIKNAVVSITMGRVDITETSYSNGNITILDVDGDIEINVQCIQVPVYTITRNLIGCTSDSNIRSIGEGNPHTERITADDGYTLQDGTVLITMGGTDITSSYSDGTLTIAEVTGDIVISIEAVEFNEDAPIIDLDLVNVGTDGVITNLGSGGSNYNAIVQLPSSSDTFSASSTGLTLNRHAYANTPYGFAPSDVFSIVCRARIITKSAQNFQRIFRTDQDTPSIFYSKSALTLGGKLAGVSGNGNASHDEVAHFPSTLNTCYLGYQDETAFDESIVHTFIHTSDGTTIKWYVDGVLMASQNAEALKTSTLVGLGDNNPSQNYYATSIEVSEFKIYNRVIEIE